MHKLFQNVDFLLVQEHCHYDINIISMVNLMNDVQVYDTSIMDPNVLQTGRPNGGSAFMYSTNLKFQIIHIPVDSNRCCAVLCSVIFLTMSKYLCSTCICLVTQIVIKLI